MTSIYEESRPFPKDDESAGLKSLTLLKHAVPLQAFCILHMTLNRLELRHQAQNVIVHAPL